MRLARRDFLKVLGLAAALFGPGAAVAQNEFRLDDTRRAALAALPSLSGEALEAEGFEGQVVAVAFFASWCPPCKPEFDHLNEAARVYGDRGLTVVAVNIFEAYLKDPDGRRLKAFLTETAPRFTVVGGGEVVASLFGEVDRIPTLHIFGRDGAPILNFVHARGATKTHATFEEIAAAVESAL